MSKILKIVIALNLVFSLVSAVTVLCTDSVSLCFAVGISLLVASAILLWCVAYDYRKSNPKATEH